MTITYMTDMTYMNMTLWTNSAAKVRQCDKKKNRSGSSRRVVFDEQIFLGITFLQMTMASAVSKINYQTYSKPSK
jgi:hypothetical protein